MAVELMPGYSFTSKMEETAAAGLQSVESLIRLLSHSNPTTKISKNPRRPPPPPPPQITRPSLMSPSTNSRSSFLCSTALEPATPVSAAARFRTPLRSRSNRCRKPSVRRLTLKVPRRRIPVRGFTAPPRFRGCRRCPTTTS
ncbi:UNVERIFIED_CONTAM: hypothetical protein Slati_2368400 [Sesamum latifolium]|uniref:Uncharacterized protein n=1 Tax=Sesamum latifolium TaxID=2727402 RepID=A0AAW2WC00_9LAMI